MVNDNFVPKWIGRHLDATGQAAIEAAIKKAETATSAEIVPVIVQRSIQTSSHPIVVMLLMLTIFLSGDGLYWQHVWLGPQAWLMPLNLIVAALIAWPLARLSVVQRLLTAQADQSHAVHTAAQAAFLTAGLAHTKSGTGILIFISLVERQTVVLADVGISQKLDASTWDAVVDTINRAIKSDSLSAGIVKGIETLTELVAIPFPRQADDQDELPNKVVFLDPSGDTKH